MAHAPNAPNAPNANAVGGSQAGWTPNAYPVEELHSNISAVGAAEISSYHTPSH